MRQSYREVRERLRYVGTERDDYDLTRFPDFLIIGPQRTGTTWLAQGLKRHPQIFIPWQKEIHYFNNLEYPEYHPKSLPPIDKDLGWYTDMFRVPEAYRVKRDAECRRELSRPYSPVAFGDITATYAAALHEGIIAEIMVLNPDIKVVALVRDPVERAWSHAKKDLSTERKRSVADVPDAEWLEFFRREYQINCGHYTTFLPRWQKFVPEQNMLIARFRDLENNPRKLITRVHRLLGVDVDDAFIGPEIETRNPGLALGLQPAPTERGDIPPHLHAELEQLFGEETAKLRERGLM